jgi:outer membrane immunogenic protein
MKRILLASVGVMAMAGLIGTASAADLSRQQQIYKAPAYVAPVNNWTGFYIGLNGGGGWGSSNWNGVPAKFDVSGGMVGGTLGYNWQFGTWVVGLEGDIDWSNINGSDCGGFCQTKNDFLSTIRGRVGYTFDRWMPYVTGGAAIGNIKATSPGSSDVSGTNVGWTVGTGIEYAFAPNWSAKVEYLYVDLGNIDCGSSLSASCAISGPGNKVDFTTNIVRGGVNFRF